MKTQFVILIFLCCLINSCTLRNKEGVEQALKIYDSSLDSLIIEETTNQSRYTILLGGDTLFNSPKRVVEYFVKTENNSKRDSSNYRTSTFKKNQLITFKQEDDNDQILIEKRIYFNEVIDDSLLVDLRVKNKDTAYVGIIEKYNDKGYLLKSVSSSKMRFVGDNDLRDTRLVSIFQYDTINNQVIEKRRFYLQNGFLVDSLKKVSIVTLKESLLKTVDSTLSSVRAIKYDYQYDIHGNWILKRTIVNLLPNEERIYREDYREITY